MSKATAVPVITVGRYAGTPIDQLPNSYLRWMMYQDFPREWLECAHEKLSQSEYNDTHINISRHAVDMFSKRFFSLWIPEIRSGENGKGLGTFIAELAEEAWNHGEDVSKNRHQSDGIIKKWKGVKFVFIVSKTFPQYKDVVTVFEEEYQS